MKEEEIKEVCVSFTKEDVGNMGIDRANELISEKVIKGLDDFVKFSKDDSDRFDLMFCAITRK